MCWFERRNGCSAIPHSCPTESGLGMTHTAHPAPLFLSRRLCHPTLTPSFPYQSPQSGSLPPQTASSKHARPTSIAGDPAPCDYLSSFSFTPHPLPTSGAGEQQHRAQTTTPAAPQKERGMDFVCTRIMAFSWYSNLLKTEKLGDIIISGRHLV
jgi:hypothetical protein